MRTGVGKGSGWREVYIYPGLATITLISVLSHSSIAEAGGLVRYDFSLGTAYRHARLDWNIAGNLAGAAPNILSELIWHDLDIAQLNGAVQVSVNDRLVLRGSAAYGGVVNGKVQDSDYDGDNRTMEFLRSNSEGRGQVADASIGLGYHFRIYDQTAGRYAHLTPMAGYSRHIQYLKITDGMQTIPAKSPIANLDSRYDADWSGPWLGVNLRMETSERSALTIDFEYHWADYYAKADWNLRDDLVHPVSYRHDTTGVGVVASLAFSQALSKRWGFIVRIESQNWTTNPGVDTLYTINSSSGAVQPDATRLNEVNWRSVSAGVEATYRF